MRTLDQTKHENKDAGVPFKNRKQLLEKIMDLPNIKILHKGKQKKKEDNVPLINRDQLIEKIKAIFPPTRFPNTFFVFEESIYIQRGLYYFSPDSLVRFFDLAEQYDLYYTLDLGGKKARSIKIFIRLEGSLFEL
jgi:hypothetical protein